MEELVLDHTTERKPMEEPVLEIIRFCDDAIAASGGGIGDDPSCPCNTTDDVDECDGYCSGYTCLAKGTKITMADGSTKNIEEIQVGDAVLAFDHKTGCLTSQKIYIVFQGDIPSRAFTLHFTGGVDLSIVGVHDLFEQESRKYVRINETTAEQLIGRHFFHALENRFEELLSVTYEQEPVEYYCLYSEYTLNFIANGMLNVADDVDCYLNFYEFEADLSINQQALAADFERYGVYEYPADAPYLEHDYDRCLIPYVNIIVGKGLAAYEELYQSWGEYVRTYAVRLPECPASSACPEGVAQTA